MAGNDCCRYSFQNTPLPIAGNGNLSQLSFKINIVVLLPSFPFHFVTVLNTLPPTKASTWSPSVRHKAVSSHFQHAGVELDYTGCASSSTSTDHRGWQCRSRHASPCSGYSTAFRRLLLWLGHLLPQHSPIPAVQLPSRQQSSLLV